MDHKYLYLKYKTKYLELKYNMTGGARCCPNNCGHNSNPDPRNNTGTCCGACKGQSGPHTQHCMDRQNKCINSKWTLLIC